MIFTTYNLFTVRYDLYLTHDSSGRYTTKRILSFGTDKKS